MDEKIKKIHSLLKYYHKKGIEIKLYKINDNPEVDIKGAVNELSRCLFDFNRPYVVIGEMKIFLEDIDLNSIIPTSMLKKSQNKKEQRCPIPPKQRLRILKRDKYSCQKCGAAGPDIEVEVDHIVPVMRGGSDEDSNLQTLCYRCNRGKGGDLDD